MDDYSYYSLKDSEDPIYNDTPDPIEPPTVHRRLPHARPVREEFIEDEDDDLVDPPPGSDHLALALRLLSKVLHGDIRVDVMMFYHHLDLNALVDWIDVMETVFDYKRITGRKCVVSSHQISGISPSVVE